MAANDPRLAKLAQSVAARLRMEHSFGVDTLAVHYVQDADVLPPRAVDAHPWQPDGVASVPTPTPSSVSVPPTPALQKETEEVQSPAAVVQPSPRTVPAAASSPSPVRVSDTPNRGGRRSSDVPEGDAGSPERMAALRPIRQQAEQCRLCGLCESRNHVIFGEGLVDTDLLVVAEAPGRDEDEQGRPFVGRSGRLLTRIIEGGLKRSRASVYISNILKCRPPGNRDPKPDEVAACLPYLQKQIEIIQPKVIVCLGRIAGNILTGQDLSMGRMRGQWFEYEGISLMPIYHPAYLLRQRGRSDQKTDADRRTWEDLQNITKKLNEL